MKPRKKNILNFAGDVLEFLFAILDLIFTVWK